jgi:uncharacterized membrane protein
VTLLVIGLVVWTLAHALKRVAPGARGSLDRAVGAKPARGVMSVLILLGLVLIVWGFRRAPVIPVYDPAPWAIHVNNLLMVIAVLLLGLGHSKSRARGWLRHPMLTAVVVWAVAHLLVNGDEASLIMFGWLGLWAIGDMALINAREPVWTRPEGGSLTGDVRLVVIGAVIFAVIVTIHTLLGYSPFPP